jgi:hypothetical protein
MNHEYWEYGNSLEMRMQCYSFLYSPISPIYEQHMTHGAGALMHIRHTACDMRHAKAKQGTGPNTQAYAYIHTYIHTFIHTYIHTYILSRVGVISHCRYFIAVKFFYFIVDPASENTRTCISTHCTLRTAHYVLCSILCTMLCALCTKRF